MKEINQSEIKKIFDSKTEKENEPSFQETTNGSTIQKVKTTEKKNKKEFWKTQPVMKIDEVNFEYGKIEDDKEVSMEPIKVNNEFEWETINLLNPKELDELYTFLDDNYVEDKSASFRLNYSREFLLWAMTPPGWKKEWHLGLKVKKSKKLVAFISAIPSCLRIGAVERECVVDINFLCVARKIREKRVAVVAIKEITRRVNLQNFYVAVFTNGIFLSFPVVSCRYWHRSINVRKLVEVGFVDFSKTKDINEFVMKYELPKNTSISGLRLLEEKDCVSVMNLLHQYLKLNTLIHPVYELDEFRHWFLPKQDVITSYVVENPLTNEITDFFSFYTLHTKVLNNPKHSIIRTAYLYYYVSTTTPLNKLLANLLTVASEMNYDLVNALDVMNNINELKDLKFGIGDGKLQYYFYNYKCPKLEPNEVGLVML